jgi:hypothetical protein
VRRVRRGCAVCAVLFCGNIYGFFIFPLGVTTDFLGRFFKSIIYAIYVSKKNYFQTLQKSKQIRKATNGCNLQFRIGLGPKYLDAIRS